MFAFRPSHIGKDLVLVKVYAPLCERLCERPDRRAGSEVDHRSSPVENDGSDVSGHARGPGVVWRAEETTVSARANAVDMPAPQVTIVMCTPDATSSENQGP